MSNWLQSFQLERISFLLGFLAATLLWWVLSKARKWLPDIKNAASSIQNKVRTNRTSGVLIALKKDVLRRAQSNHIAAQLFALDEILIEPILLLPPDHHYGNENLLFESEIPSMIPYAPDLPLLSKNFFVPRIKITDAVQAENYILISGQPGAGKTVCLAYLASRLAENHVVCGNQAGKIPFYFHILETDLLLNPEQSLIDVIYKALSPNIASSHLPKLAKFIQNELRSNNALLLIDGIDELYRHEADIVIGFIEKVIGQFPDLKIIATSSPHYSGKLNALGFVNLPLSPLSNRSVRQLNQKWVENWYKSILTAGNALQTFSKEKLLANWINMPFPAYTPLESTLLLWGALSGDLRGFDTLSIYESHFARIFQNNYTPEALGELAASFIREKSSSIRPRNLDSGIISTLAEWGVLRKYSDMISFRHIDFCGFLASLANNLSLPAGSLPAIAWNPIEYSLLSFSAARNTQTHWVESYFAEPKSPMFINLLLVIPWLRHTTSKTAWRTNLFKILLKNIQDPRILPAIKLRFLYAFIIANDPSAVILLRQLLTNPNEVYKRMALICIASLGEYDLFHQELVNLIPEAGNELLKYIVMVLSIHESEYNLDVLARLLLSASEDTRKLLTECLAQMSDQAREILKDAVTMEDILVRRSAIFGLVHLDELWAYEVLKKLTVEDSQWVIRDLASQATDFIQHRTHWQTKKRIPLYETDWLIQFASTQNIGISPEQDPAPLLLEVLKSGTEAEKVKSLAVLPAFINASDVPVVLDLSVSDHGQVCDAAVNAIWQIYSSGLDISAY